MHKFKFEYRITLIYLLLGGCWILFSDKLLLYFIKDNRLLTEFQTFKGWFYVIITAVLFYSVLTKHLAKIRNAEQKAKDNDRLKSAFLQNISHEIRTPMNGIIGFASLLSDQNLTTSQRLQYTGIITESSNRLLKIVNDILDISLIETGNSIVYEDTVHLNNLIDEFYNSFVPLINSQVNFTIEKGLSNNNSEILTDELKLRQVIKNLLTNAINFTEKGHIKLGYTLKGKELEIFVEDSGIGIPPHLLGQIFEPFQKAETDKLKFYEGAGLGLAICKGYTELLQGKIRVQSQADIGSTFYVTIPYKPLDSRSEIVNPGKKNRFLDFETICLLIVEDEEFNYLYIKEIFEGTGVTIHHALNGEEAVECCRNNKDINLVLMDLKMPNMNGLEATRIIRKIRPDLPIIAQSAFAQKGEREIALLAGCNDFIAKPFKKEDVFKIIRNLE